MSVERAPTRVQRVVASPKGNGCGLALVRLSGGATLVVSVIPKWWAPYCIPVSVDLDVLRASANQVRHVVVPELAHLLLLSRDEGALNAVAAALTGLRFSDADERGDEQKEAPLFEAAAPQGVLANVEGKWHGGEGDTAAEAAMLAEALWAGVESLSASDLIRLPLRESTLHPALLTREHLADVPALERVFRELFIREVEVVLRRRTPEFRRNTEVLPFIRGRVRVESLVEAKARKTLKVECEFDELDHDHPWQRLVRAAVRAVAARDLAELEGGREGVSAARVNRCRSIDRHMSEVPSISPDQAVRIRPSEINFGRNRHAALAAQLARYVLLRDSPAGFSSDRTERPAVATGVRISSARLFERLLARTASQTGRLQLRENSALFPLLRGELATKRPDLLITMRGEESARPRVVALADAKNKSKVAMSPGSMSAPDQYQQFAYAAMSGLPTVFIFATATSASWPLSAAHEINVRGLDDGPQVATAQVPFPAPFAGAWAQQLASPVRSVLEEFLAEVPTDLEGPVGRQ